MTDTVQETVDIVETDDDQEAFEKEFFQTKTETVEVKAEPVEEPDDNLEDDPLEQEEEEAEEPEVEEEEPEEDPKPKKNRASAKERIDELTADKYELRRERDALRAELQSLKTAVPEKTETPLREQLSPDAPNPDAVDKDGNAIYALGEFDKQYIADLTKFSAKAAIKEAREEADLRDQASAFQQAQQELATNWDEKLNTFEKEVPEIRDDIRDLTDTFQSLEPAYGEYLATTIMMSEAGPEIMHYLSQNIGEAQKIVASGAAAATLALGRLEAKLLKPSNEEEPKRNKRVSQASEPPVSATRGNRGQFAVRGDTDDQDAFEREFFKS